jgi:hypothetical protein
VPDHPVSGGGPDGAGDLDDALGLDAGGGTRDVVHRVGALGVDVRGAVGLPSVNLFGSVKPGVTVRPPKWWIEL